MVANRTRSECLRTSKRALREVELAFFGRCGRNDGEQK
jgi:hypothetical protein